MAKDIVTRDEFESLKDAFLRLKDILSDCNLKVDANFDDIDLDDYSEDNDEPELEEEEDGNEGKFEF